MYTNSYTNSFTRRATGSTHLIELLTNHGSGTGIEGMTTAANITKTKKSNAEFAMSDFLYE